MLSTGQILQRAFPTDGEISPAAPPRPGDVTFSGINVFGFPRLGQANSDAAPAPQADALFLETLERIGVGAVLLDPFDKALAFNPTAGEIFLSEVGPRLRNDACEWASRSLRTLIARAQGKSRCQMTACMTVPRENKRDLVLQSTPVTGFHRLMLLIDLSGAPHPTADVLQRMFRLTAAEARLAIQIAGGASPAEIARTNKVGIATVRSQLASVFAKTDTGRQLELASLLSRVALLS